VTAGAFAARSVRLFRSLSSPECSGFLSSFIGHTPDGEWTLFLADLSPVGEARLESWGLELEYKVFSVFSAALW